MERAGKAKLGLAHKAQSTEREVRRSKTGTELLTELEYKGKKQSADIECQSRQGSKGLPHVIWDFFLILRAPPVLKTRVSE